MVARSEHKQLVIDTKNELLAVFLFMKFDITKPQQINGMAETLAGIVHSVTSGILSENDAD